MPAEEHVSSSPAATSGANPASSSCAGTIGRAVAGQCHVELLGAVAVAAARAAAADGAATAAAAAPNRRRRCRPTSAGDLRRSELSLVSLWPAAS